MDIYTDMTEAAKDVGGGYTGPSLSKALADNGTIWIKDVLVTNNIKVHKSRRGRKK